jgi:hypothetical protein
LPKSKWLLLGQWKESQFRKTFPKKLFWSQMWQLPPIILATWEAKIGRIVVWGQARQKSKTPSQPIQNKNTKWGTVARNCHASYVTNLNRKITVQVSLGINLRPYFKSNQSKRGGRHGLPAQPARGPEFKLQYNHQKKPKKNCYKASQNTKDPANYKQATWDPGISSSAPYSILLQQLPGQESSPDLFI